MRDVIAGIDIGYGFTKTFSGGNGRKFPTAVTSLVPTASFGEVSPVVANGDKFLVGDDAVREGKGLIDTRTTGFVKSNAWLAVLGHALIQNGMNTNDGTPRTLVLGIPPGQYSKERARQISETVRTCSIGSNGDLSSFERDTVSVIPQGAGIFFAYAASVPSDLNRDVAVVDIGHYTVDMLFFSNGRYIESATTSAPLGVSLIADEIGKAFSHRHGITISQKQILRLLNYSSITILEESYSIGDLRPLIAPFATQIGSIINGFFENLPNKPEIGLAGGGGVATLKGMVNLKYKLHIVDRPDMANAEGYWHYGKGLRR